MKFSKDKCKACMWEVRSPHDGVPWDGLAGELAEKALAVLAKSEQARQEPVQAGS